MIRLNNSRHFFYPITSKTRINHNSLTQVFPRFSLAKCLYYELWLVHWIAVIVIGQSDYFV